MVHSLSEIYSIDLIFRYYLLYCKIKFKFINIKFKNTFPTFKYTILKISAIFKIQSLQTLSLAKIAVNVKRRQMNR